MTKQPQPSVVDMHINACYMTDLNHFIDRPRLHKKNAILIQYWVAEWNDVITTAVV